MWIILLLATLTGDIHPDDFLLRVGKSVEDFARTFTAVTCTESVQQTKLGEKGAVLYQQDGLFDYLMLMDFNGDEPSVEESRIEQKTTGKGKNLPLAVTSGFPTLLLVFHPYYQGDFEYQFAGEEVLEGTRTRVIRFRHIQGQPTTTVLRLRGRDYPLDLAGTAWIEPSTGSIVKISAGLESSLDDLGLKALNADVRYVPMVFTAGENPQWMPSLATIDITTVRQHWRNTHRFLDYKRFSIKSETTVKK